MIRLMVWVTLPDGEHVRGGEMICGDPGAHGKIEGAFRYSENWLARADRFALDPIELPLTADEFVCDQPRGIFQVFEDSLPDDWGRRLLIRRANLSREEQNYPNLLKALNGNALGALSYFPENYQPQKHGSSILELEHLVVAALKYESGQPLDNKELQMLFAAASSPGGARPKALVSADDGQWIAKFPSVKDIMGMIEIEAATLSLAKKAGLKVPEFKIQQCGRHKVLLIKRFDVSERGGRNHMISFQTLMQASGYYVLGYLDIIERLRRYTGQPRTDIPAFYRQMTFNALIGNTDDHLKNFSLLHDNRGYHLSPAYDLLPDTADRREHVLHFGSDFHYFGPKQLLSLGKRAQIPQYETIIEEVRETLDSWKKEFKHWKVSDADIKRLAVDIDRRRKL